jgi:hypothetical protein
MMELALRPASTPCVKIGCFLLVSFPLASPVAEPANIYRIKAPDARQPNSEVIGGPIYQYADPRFRYVA